MIRPINWSFQPCQVMASKDKKWNVVFSGRETAKEKAFASFERSQTARSKFRGGQNLEAMPLPPEWTMSLCNYNYHPTVGLSTKAFPHLRYLLPNGSMTPYKLNKCAACFKQFNRMEHLVDHMRTSFHSVHEPMCGICQKHCRSFESLREHLIGPLPKLECARVFAVRGCSLCLAVVSYRIFNSGTYDELIHFECGRTSTPHVVAVSCKMVGGGSDGSLDLCARVCLIDESERIIFHTFVKPQIPVTNYRYEIVGIRPEYLRDAMPLKQVQRKIQDFLCNGEPVWKTRSSGGNARIFVGHGLDCLGLEYPPHMIRYDIQTGIQDPYEDCVSTMRLYMRMRSQFHAVENYPMASDAPNQNNFASWRQNELERMTPEQMLEISRSDYYCWCLDAK
ncbi:hypothetical protein Sjap_016080 [Stephania japonica]|uniref:C2H2-type domain-containing protein n=1 Tax=Stephania japonica TaxID=461633 RepID=A0AAP0IKF9_9MAGN